MMRDGTGRKVLQRIPRPDGRGMALADMRGGNSFRNRRIHLIYEMHNMHLLPPRRWDSDLYPVYRRVLTRIDGDGRDGHPDRAPARRHRRAPRPHDQHVRRPQPGRRARAAGGAAASATRTRDDGAAGDAEAARRTRSPRSSRSSRRCPARGSRSTATAASARLEAEIERGLGGSVGCAASTRRARDALWRSSAFLLTSVFEGYPLATLESMSRGCPVVSYDVRYGPREQITDGVDGFVVPPGDVARSPQRVVELLRSPELVPRMSAAARRRAARSRAGEQFAGQLGRGPAARPWSRTPQRTRIKDGALRAGPARALRAAAASPGSCGVRRTPCSTSPACSRGGREPRAHRNASPELAWRRRRERRGHRAAARGRARRPALRAARAPLAGCAGRAALRLRLRRLGVGAELALPADRPRGASRAGELRRPARALKAAAPALRGTVARDPGPRELVQASGREPYSARAAAPRGEALARACARGRARARRRRTRRSRSGGARAPCGAARPPPSVRSPSRVAGARGSRRSR